MIASVPNLLEGLAFPAFVALYIWKFQEASPKTWLLFPLWLVISFALHRDSLKSLGWRADNLKPATLRAVPVFLLFTVMITIAGIFLGALHRLPAHLVEPRRFVGYFAFCTLQQVALQSMTMNRLLSAFPSANIAAIVGGLLFAALHWPNPVLVPLTLLGG